MTINDEHLDNLLLAAAPFTDDQLAGLSYGGAPRPVRRSSRRLIAVGAGLCLSVAVAVPAAAALFTSHTGIFYNGGGEAGRGENLVLGAPDVVDVYRKHLAAYPLPPQGTWDKLLYRAAHPRPDVEMVSTATESVVEGWVAFESQCQWQRYWITSHTANDAAAMARAQTVLDAIPDWAITKAQDGGNMASSERELAAQTRHGDATLITQDVKANCS